MYSLSGIEVCFFGDDVNNFSKTNNSVKERHNGLLPILNAIHQNICKFIWANKINLQI